MELTRWQRLRARGYLLFARVTRGMTLGVRVMLIEGDNVLLIRHTYVPGWQLPGGGIEPGEDGEESAGRELREETGYRLVGRPQLFGFYHNLNSATNRDYVALYLSRSFVREVELRPDLEIAERGWFARSALPAETTPGTSRRIDEVFAGRPPDVRW